MPPQFSRGGNTKKKPEKKKASTADVLRPVAKKKATTTRPVSTADVLRPIKKATPRTRYDLGDEGKFPKTYMNTDDNTRVSRQSDLQRTTPTNTTFGSGGGSSVLPPMLRPGTDRAREAQAEAGQWRDYTLQPRPEGAQPPASTGPIINPQGELRARSAAEHGFGDAERSQLAHMPIYYGPEPTGRTDVAGVYFPDKGKLDIYDLGKGVQPHMAGTMAHEMGHRRWFEDLNARNVPMEKDFIRDTEALYDTSPAAQRGLDWWQDVEPFYQKHYGLNIGPGHASELYAETGDQATGPQDMPDWYRSKWYPRVWRDTDTRMGNQTNRFDKEIYDPALDGPDENGRYG
jgi:hypothetical protein